MDKSIRKWAVDACIVFTITVAMLAAAESAARIAALVEERTEEPVGGSDGLSRKFPWSAQHAADMAKEVTEHVTYVEFREKPLRSPTLNIDAQGRRVVPGTCEKDGAFTLMTFGGSTMYGAGVPDQFTIPAYLAVLLNKNGRCVKVVNYGAGWWQSSQSLFQLIEVLKSGIRPDAVIFYDGINDINAVASGGKPGGINPEVDDALKSALEPDRIGLLRSVARNSEAIAFLRRLFSSSAGKNAANDYAVPETLKAAYAGSIADIYAAKVRTVDALSREFRFDAYFYLQPCPMIAAKRNTALETAAFATRARARPWEADFFRQVYTSFRRHPYLSANSRFRDLSGIFDGMTDELYFDSERLQPEGNRIVAATMATEVSLAGLRERGARQ